MTERRQKEVRPQSVVAVHFSTLPIEQFDELFDEMDQVEHGIHFESESFLFKPEDARELIEKFNGEDVTDIYQELTSRTEGFRIVRVGRPYASDELARYKNKAMIIKHYKTGVMFVYNEYGRSEGTIPAENAAVAFSPSRFETVLERPLVFFDTLEAVVSSRQAA